MSASLTRIEKKLVQLKANKEKEEKRYKDNVEKITNKYNEDQKTLKENFNSKIAETKKELNEKLGIINPEIVFYENQKQALIDLEARMASIQEATNARLSGNKVSEEE